jgi:glyoxylase-like metal-dependent hydrolase (beta-lactamase superfamily II)
LRRKTMQFKNLFTGFFCFILALTLGACAGTAPGLSGVVESPKLAQHSQEFEKKIYKVADGVYSAVGYGIANSIMLVGPDGVVIVDTMETREEGFKVWNDFRKLTDLPLKAIIYTHFHPDHIYGAAAFAGSGSPAVYAHETTDNAVRRFSSETAPIISDDTASAPGRRMPG